MGRQAPGADLVLGESSPLAEQFAALHPRPQVPWMLVLVCIPALAGLAGLFIRAEGAFEAIARSGPWGRWEGLLIAIFIEGANVAEGMILFRPRREGDHRWPVLAAMAVSFVVSIFYNYAVGIAHADQAGEYLFSRHLHVAVLSAGVTVALVSFGMVLGELYAEWRREVERWEGERAAWLERERARRERREHRRRRRLEQQAKEPAKRASPAPTAEKRPYREQAVGVLDAQPGIGPRALAREIGCSPSTASALLRRLRSAEGEGEPAATLAGDNHRE